MEELWNPVQWNKIHMSLLLTQKILVFSNRGSQKWLIISVSALHQRLSCSDKQDRMTKFIDICFKWVQYSTKSECKQGETLDSLLETYAELFSQLYISCQMPGGWNLDDYLGHENQVCPPALSGVGSLCLGTKSDVLLVSFEEISDARSRKPTFTSIVLDGAAVE
jgi:hypothetical protein